MVERIVGSTELAVIIHGDSGFEDFNDVSTWHASSVSLALPASRSVIAVFRR
ncbi:hypothetical protein [Bradyrhizobium sp. B120]|uniref:hypothetical protein n=1 Tax=Bradyrhizobium sp. B120 TaxID=3410088 RepID=UPI003B9819E6